MIHEKDRVVCIRSGPQNVSDDIAVCMQRLNRDYAGQMIRSRCSGCAAKYGYEKHAMAVQHGSMRSIASF